MGRIRRQHLWCQPAQAPLLFIIHVLLHIVFLETSLVKASTVVVIPCYNEEQRLPAQEYVDFLNSPIGEGVSFLFVNDGSTDKTLSMLQALKDQLQAQFGSGRVDVLDLQPNGGKAEAVRKGMLAAVQMPGAEIVGFWDGDLATPLAAIDDLRGVLRGRENAPSRARAGKKDDALPPVQMAFGARVGLLGRDVTRSMSRHYLGRAFATLASLLLAMPIYDTQCGAKLFLNSEMLQEALLEPFSAGWIFDVELLARLKRAHAAREQNLQDLIFEYPLHRWHDLPGSKLGLRSKVSALWGLARIWYEHSSPWTGPWPKGNQTSKTASAEL